VGVLVALRPATSTAYAYDTRGNRTSKTPSGGSTTALGYDQANRLTAFGTTATYVYNGDGTRTSKNVSGNTSAFVWDQAEGLPLLLVDGSTNYVYGPSGLPLEQVSGSTVYYFHHDQLGSSRVLTNSAGAPAATYTYDSYGKLIASTGSVTNPFGFAGQYTDSESGFQYLRARAYDPATGQFLSRDALTPNTKSPYSYANDSPLDFTDPTGLCGEPPGFIGPVLPCPGLQQRGAPVVIAQIPYGLQSGETDIHGVTFSGDFSITVMDHDWTPTSISVNFDDTTFGIRGSEVAYLAGLGGVHTFHFYLKEKVPLNSCTGRYDSSSPYFGNEFDVKLEASPFADYSASLEVSIPAQAAAAVQRQRS
jgi:RHS repeat-associated protein